MTKKLEIKNKTLFILIVMTTITSCEYNGPYFYEIENESNYSIDLYFNVGNHLDSAKSIEPSMTETFYMHDDFNGMSDLNENFLTSSSIDSIYLSVNPDSLKINKNPMIHENWEYSTNPIGKDKEGKGGDNIYTFTVTDGDII